MSSYVSSSWRAAVPVVGAVAVLVADGRGCTGVYKYAAAEENRLDSNCPLRVTTAVHAANHPIEDTFFAVAPTSGGGSGVAGAFAVFDGHGGAQVSRYCKRHLLDRFYQALEDRGQDGPGDGRIRASLLSSFAQVEREIAQALKPAFDMGFGSVARVGACATVAVVTEERLYVANAGDCRAVLGQSGGSSEEGVMAVELTEVHNACIPLEKERLQASHPTEPIEKLVRCRRKTSCYVKGFLQPTRSLGDLFLKYPEFNGSRPPYAEHSYIRSDKQRARRVRAPYDPPYVDPVPEVVVHSRDSARDKFLILASDGLWDEMEPGEAVAIVQQCREGVAAGVEGAPVAPQTPAEGLVSAALERAAYRCGMSVEELKRLPYDKKRSRHDDITVVVVEL
jgi:pyruvate dehydrogenase phosphatase